METCTKCGNQIHRDGTAWVDNSGGDVCGVDGENSPHTPDADAQAFWFPPKEG
jgi:hypothetical protein